MDSNEIYKIKEAAEKWGVSTRRVQDLCKQGKIPGAQLWERTWMPPSSWPCRIDFWVLWQNIAASWAIFWMPPLALRDPEALKELKNLHKQLHQGWTKLHNAVLDKSVSAALSVREREVARLAAYGLSDQEIAEQLNLSFSVRMVYNA